MSTIQYPPGTAGRRLGITRIISKTIGGLPWTFAYDNDGRLVTMMPNNEYEMRVLEKRGKPEEGAALEFQHLFRTDSGDDESILDDNDWPNGRDPRDGIGALVEKFAHDALYKSVSTADATWDEVLTATALVEKRGSQFEKRSSSRYKILLEKTKIDGEDWVLGYDHLGTCVHSTFIGE